MKKVKLKKVKLEEFNLASSGHGWLLELIIENKVIATQLLKQEEAPLLKNQREFRASHSHIKGGVVNFCPVLVN
jgi:hypothetical protein